MPFVEPPWCARLGTPFSHDLGKDGLSPKAIANPPIFNRARAAAHYSGPARDLVLALKFARRRDVAAPMGRWMARAGTELLTEHCVIVPVPLHRMRLWQRRFNQAADLANVVASVSGCAFEPGLLRRSRNTRHQVGLDPSARQRNVRGAFQMCSRYESSISGKQVVLIDDVFTTGSTAAACTRVLERAGASTVDILTFANADPSTDMY